MAQNQFLKNIIDFKGKPLIAWSIEASLNSKYISKTIVSSDSDEILNISSEYGAEVLKRSEELALDNTKTEPVLIDVLEKIEESYDYLVLLQATSPLRTEKHIDEAIDKFLKDDAKSLISVYEPDHSPLKAFKINKKGQLEGIVNNEYPFMPRQNLPRCFYPNGAIYIVEVDYFINSKKLFAENQTSYYEMFNESNIDIDSLEDLNLALSNLN